MNYCPSSSHTERWKTREVLVGTIGIGGSNPIRIQSMTTSNTREAQATADQIMRLADSGCELVRVTVQGIKEAESCEEIKNILLQKGYSTPLVADIHFFPPAALTAVEFVDKIRINPGNYADKRASFKQIEYSPATYEEELRKIEEKFSPLVEKCKKYRKALRIGTNHGSLSDRIMNRYGDSPKGMVESALEFAHICRKLDFHNFLFSMKSSNPLIMIEAYRLLVFEMRTLGWNYPLHLGVTEAGLGEDGRIKSALGIGALLLDGLGDTIRVSLTEDPWYEIDPCKRLIEFAKKLEGTGVAPFIETHRDFRNLHRREVSLPKNLSLHPQTTVVMTSSSEEVLDLDPPQADMVVDKDQIVSLELFKHSTSLIPFVRVEDDVPSSWAVLESHRPQLIFLSPTKNRIHYARHFFEWLKQNNLSIPVILNFSYTCSLEDLTIHAAVEIGSLLADNLGEGVLIEGPYPIKTVKELSFNILQAARKRMIKTDFISCPSCGRTLFNLQEVTARIRAQTAHLPGVKIAIMGCIVNGPGEMADADFGYVGSKAGKIDLYVGKTCVEKNIDSEIADQKLIELIKTHGRWIEPSSV